MAINDLTFNELLKRGVKQTPKGRLWNLADSRLWYITPEQAEAYLALEKSKGYREGLIEAEIKLIRQNLDTIIPQLLGQQYNLIDLGCGKGEKAAIIIDGFDQKINSRYCPVDINSKMIEIALDTVRGLGIDGVECKENISDFENLENVIPTFRKGGYESSLILFLGNLIGNFEGETILEGIHKSIGLQDYLIIGTEIRGKKEIGDIIQEYNSEYVNNFLILTPKNVGLTEDELIFEKPEFNNKRVELFYRVRKDKTIEHLGNIAEFKSGDRIFTAFSHKYTQNELKQLLEKRFETSIYQNKENTYALALCKKK